MKPKQALAILLFTIPLSGFSQDIIVLKNGDELKTRVIEVLPEIIKYKKWDNQQGPNYSELKSNVFMIKYENGSKDVFNSTSPIIANAPAANNEDVKKATALKELEQMFINTFKDGKKRFSLLNFSKTNGIPQNINGQFVYQLDFEVTVQATSELWLKGNNMEGYWKNGFDTYTSPPILNGAENMMYNIKSIPRGTILVFGCKGSMQQTDAAYLLKDFRISTIKDTGVQPMRGASQSFGAPEPPPVSNKAVDLSTIKGTIELGGTFHTLAVDQIAVVDELNNIAEAQEKIKESLIENSRIKYKSDKANVDTYLIKASTNMSYRNMSSNPNSPIYFADCIFSLSLVDKTQKVLFQNTYKLTNYSLLSKGFPTKIEANRNLISKSLNQAVSQFIIGNFPIKGDITEVKELNRKQDEAKTVQINIGKSSGVLRGFQFVLLGSENEKGDLEVTESFDDYSVCKVLNNSGRRVLELSKGPDKIKIVTKYKPSL